MDINVVRYSENEWRILLADSRMIARLYLDYLAQIDEVVLSPGVTQDEALKVLHLAGSHAERYFIHRRYKYATIEGGYQGHASREVSASMLTDGVVPNRVAEMGINRLTERLGKVEVEVIWASVHSLTEAIQTALDDPRFPFQVTSDIGRYIRGLGYQRVEFMVQDPGRFRIWHHVDKPRPGSSFDLYIVPGYHPDRSDSTLSVGLINGTTNALIGSRAIEFVYAPPESYTTSGKGFGSSWDNVNHPFYAEGKSISMDVFPNKLLSLDGIQELQKVLLATLELENTYLSVSGGFGGSYTHPANVANRFRFRTGDWGGDVRGSEGFCVWAYQTLEREGELERAYIPSWFRTEPWLRMYERYGRERP